MAGARKVVVLGNGGIALEVIHEVIIVFDPQRKGCGHMGKNILRY